MIATSSFAKESLFIDLTWLVAGNSTSLIPGRKNRGFLHESAKVLEENDSIGAANKACLFDQSVSFLVV